MKYQGDLDPYPWPVKPALLFLLGLPNNTTEENYHERWMEIFHPIRLKGGKFNNDLLEKHIQELMAEHKVDWTRAANMASQTAHGRRLIAASEDDSATKHKKQDATNTNRSPEATERSLAFNRRVDELMRPHNQGGKGCRSTDEAISEMRRTEEGRALLHAMGHR